LISRGLSTRALLKTLAVIVAAGCAAGEPVDSDGTNPLHEGSGGAAGEDGGMPPGSGGAAGDEQGGSGGADTMDAGGSGGEPDADPSTGGAAGSGGEATAGSGGAAGSAGNGGEGGSGGAAGSAGSGGEAGSGGAAGSAGSGGGVVSGCSSTVDLNQYTPTNAGCGGYASGCKGQIHVTNTGTTTWTTWSISFTVASGVTCTKTHSGTKWTITDNGSSSHQCVFTAKNPDGNAMAWDIPPGGTWAFGYDTSQTNATAPSDVTITVAGAPCD
jgi:hypothetical protein